MLNAKLLVVGGDAKSGEVLLRLPTTIGRGREATLTLPHPLVSRVHCEIVEREGRLVVKDLSSLNGTFVNNKRIEGEQALDPEQLLTLGNVTFRAVYEVGVAREEAESPEPAPEVAQDDKTELESVPAPPQTDSEAKSPDQKETVYDKERQKADTDHGVPPVKDAEGQSDTDSIPNLSGPAVTASDSAIDVLETMQIGEQSPAALSFTGGIQIDDIVAGQSDVEAVQLDLDEPTDKVDSKDSKLGSFIRKLPR